MRNALYCLAEATRGLSPELRWSLDTGILRREYHPLFDRLSQRTLTVEAALEIFVQGRAVRLHHVRTVIEERYNILLVHLTQDEQARLEHLSRFRTTLDLLDTVKLYEGDDSIMRSELRPLFTLCYNGVLDSRTTLDAVLDNVQAKRTYFLDQLSTILHELTREFVSTGILRDVLVREDAAKGSSQTGEQQ